MRRSKNPDTMRYNLWRDNNPEKADAKKLKDAFNLLLNRGVIDGERVLYDPRKR